MHADTEAGEFVVARDPGFSGRFEGEQLTKTIRELYLVAELGHAPGALLAALKHPRCPCCTEALTGALERHGCTEIFNTDQGSQFTSLEFTSALKDSGVAISMDGRAGVWTTSSSSACGAPRVRDCLPALYLGRLPGPGT